MSSIQEAHLIPRSFRRGLASRSCFATDGQSPGACRFVLLSIDRVESLDVLNLWHRDEERPVFLVHRVYQDARLAILVVVWGFYAVLPKTRFYQSVAGPARHAQGRGVGKRFDNVRCVRKDAQVRRRRLHTFEPFGMRVACRTL